MPGLAFLDVILVNRICPFGSSGLFFSQRRSDRSGKNPPRHRPSRPHASFIHGHDIIDLVASYPESIRLSELMEIVAERFGSMATFHTCSAAGMNQDELLHFLEARDKVRISSGVVFPGGTPACAN